MPDDAAADAGGPKKNRRGADPLCQRGPLLFTHDGIRSVHTVAAILPLPTRLAHPTPAPSGPCALRLSAFAARELAASRYRGTLRLNLAPALTAAQVAETLAGCRTRIGKKSVDTFSPLGDSAVVPKRLWVRLVAAAGVAAGKRWNEVSNKDVAALASAVTACAFEFDGKSPFKVSTTNTTLLLL